MKTIDGREYYFYRRAFPVGDFDGYRSATEPAAFRFEVNGEYLTGAQLADHLEAQYIQQSESGIRAAMSNYAEYRALPA